MKMIKDNLEDNKMAGNNNTLFLVIAVGVVVLLAIYMLRKSETSELSKDVPETSIEDDVELLKVEDPGDFGGFDLHGVSDYSDVFHAGFGVGPGTYGSGRATSPMIGN